MGLKEQVLEKIDITEYYSKHLEWKKQKGKNWQALCPFHDENNGSFTVQMNTGYYICFGCEEKGDLFTFQQKIANQNFNDAIRFLAKEVGVDIPEPKKKKESGKRGRPRKKKPKLDEDFCQKMHDEISDQVKNYLVGRGVSEEVIKKYKIGSWGDYAVFPIRKEGKLYNYRLKDTVQRRNPWHLSADDIGHDPIWVFPEPDPKRVKVLLCEGEIDTLQAISLGYNATTVTGGAGTFSDLYLVYFEDKKVFTCYDIDKSGRLGSILVAGKVASVADSSKIISLDLDEKKYPAGDLNDYFLKEGKTKKDFEKLIKKAKRVASAVDDLSVVEMDGCYWSIKEKKGKKVHEQISNFTFEQICRYRDVDGGIEREVFMIPAAKKSATARKVMMPTDMGSKRKFKEFCFGSGDFVFTGSEQDMDEIWKILMAQDLSAKEVSSIFGVGYIGGLDLWIFRDLVIKNQKVLKADENGICWNGKRGYFFVPLEASAINIRDQSPGLITEKKDTKKTIQEFTKKLVENVGTLNAMYGIAFACGSLYYDVILEKFNSFPILWLYGQQQCGKNEFAGFLMRMFGMGRSDGESIPEITSTVPMTRKLSYYGNLPVWFDEYRNSIKNTDKVNGVLRSSYSGMGRSLGRKASRGTIREDPVSSVIVSGEEIPEDEALLSRLLVVRLNKDWRKNELYDDVFNLSIKASAHVFSIIKQRNKETEKHLIDEIQKAILEIRAVKKWSNDRVVMNNAIALGCYRVLVGDDDGLFGDFVINGSSDDVGFNYESMKNRKMSMTLEDFVDSVSVMISDGQMSGKSWYKVDKEKNTVSIWFSSVQKTLSGLPSTRSDLAKISSSKTILNHFRETDFYISANKSVRIPNKGSLSRETVRRCLILNTCKIPDSIKGWFPDEDFDQCNLI